MKGTTLGKDSHDDIDASPSTLPSATKPALRLILDDLSSKPKIALHYLFSSATLFACSFTNRLASSSSKKMVKPSSWFLPYEYPE